MAGLPFSKERWRRFFSKNQIFMTLCMECAYIENVRTAQVKAKEQGDMFKVLQEHAANVMGQHNEYVRQNLKKRHVRAIVYHWVDQAKANILHNVKNSPYVSSTDGSFDDKTFHTKNTRMSFRRDDFRWRDFTSKSAQFTSMHK